MNFIINQKILNQHLNNVIKGISSKNLINVLNNIKLELTEEGLYLLSTNNNIAIKSFISKKDITKIINPGIIIIAGVFFHDIIKKLPQDNITIEELIDNKVKIYNNSSSFLLNLQSAMEFPIIKLEESKNPLIINQKVFKNLINQIIYATSQDEGKVNLTGINFIIKNNKIICNASDSYRIASKTIEISQTLNTEINIIVPSKNIDDLIKIIPNNDENIEIHIFNNNIIFKFSNITFMSRLINSSYPSIEPLIPNNIFNKITIKKEILYNSIDRASLLANEFTNKAINFELIADKIIISSNVLEIGNVEEIIKLKKENISSFENNFKISFTSKYILEVLKIIDGDYVDFYYYEQLNPIIIKDNNDDSLINIISLVRTA